MGENKDFVCPPGVTELKCYGERYTDLQNAFGTDYAARSTASTLTNLVSIGAPTEQVKTETFLALKF